MMDFSEKCKNMFAIDLPFIHSFCIIDILENEENREDW